MAVLQNLDSKNTEYWEFEQIWLSQLRILPENTLTVNRLKYHFKKFVTSWWFREAMKFIAGICSSPLLRTMRQSKKSRIIQNQASVWVRLLTSSVKGRVEMKPSISETQTYSVD